MSETSEKARAASKSKAERLVRADPRERVDASGYSPDGEMHNDAVTGMRPISRRAFKKGGKVEGHAVAPRADRKPRKAGGALSADSLINRDVKAANKERGGEQHDGGMKAGGRAHKMGGGALTPGQQMALRRAVASRPMSGAPGGLGARPLMRKDGGKVHKDEAQDRKLIHEMGCKCAKCHGGSVGKKAGGAAVNDGTRPDGGRMARKDGGRAKKGTTVNVIISQPPAAGAPMMPPRPPMGPPPTGMPPPGAPVGLHQGAPPPQPAVVPVGAAPSPMMRKDGGSVVGEFKKPGRYPLDAGSGGGRGRLEKAKAYGA